MQVPGVPLVFLILGALALLLLVVTLIWWLLGRRPDVPGDVGDPRLVLPESVWNALDDISSEHAREVRATRLAALSAEIAELASAVRVDAEEQMQLLSRLMVEAVQTRQFLGASNDAAYALAEWLRTEVRTELGKQERRERQRQVLRDVIIFVLGAIASVLVTLFIRPV